MELVYLDLLQKHRIVIQLENMVRIVFLILRLQIHNKDVLVKMEEMRMALVNNDNDNFINNFIIIYFLYLLFFVQFFLFKLLTKQFM